MPKAFETERLIVRDWDPERDAEDAFAIYGDPEVIRFLGVNPEPAPSVEEQRERLRKRAESVRAAGDGSGFWALESKSDGGVVGTLLLKRLPDGEGNPGPDWEIGWHLARSAWGKGYATEAARAGVEYAFRVLKLPRLHAVAYAENVKSLAVMRRLGMRQVEPTDRYYGIMLEHFELENPDGGR